MAQVFRFTILSACALLLCSCGLVGSQINRLGGGLRQMIPGQIIRVEADSEKAEGEIESTALPRELSAEA